MSAGYADPAYAAALLEVGTPRRLARSGGSLLERPVPGTGSLDGMGPYPILACEDWSGLEADLLDLRDDLVTVCGVVDPFGGWTDAQLRGCFPDVLIPFKDHFVVDLSTRPLHAARPHHRRNARRALGLVDVQLVPHPPAVIDDWHGLYRHLVARHGITGVAAFSRDSLAAQLVVPAVTVFRAVRGPETVGMTLWMRARDVVYYHLGAYSEAGYRLGASFALFATALEHFAATGAAWASLGAAAGTTARADDGLARFKRGWATGTRVAYFGGRILQPQTYAELTASSPGARSSHFPAYRAGEFA